MVGMDSSPVMIGRSVEMAALEDALDQATSGSPGVVVVGGEAGIGKSRLVEELEARVQDRALVLVGYASPTHRPAPYGPFADLLRDLARTLPPERLPAVLGPAQEELHLIVPEIEASRPPGPGDQAPETPAVSRARLFELILGIADRLQEIRPVVVIVENVQWADQGTLELLGFLAARVRSGRILLIVTVRTDEAPRDGRALAEIGELERAASVRRIELAPLAPDEVHSQIAAIRGGPAERAWADQVLARSDGNPFFVEELVAAERRGANADVPPLLHDLLRARLVALGQRTREVLRVAAIAGDDIDDQLLAAASGLPCDAVESALREAADRGLLIRRPRSPAVLSFRHALLRESIERDVLPGERRRLHAACAEALAAARHPDRAAGEIARHWLLAERGERALPAALVAALEAERRYAFADARRHFDLAISLWRELGWPDEETAIDRIDLLRHCADVTALTGDLMKAVSLAREALERIDPLEEPRRAALIHERLRWYLWESGERRAAEQALDEAARLVPHDPPSAARARVLGHLAGLRLRQGHLRESAALADDGIDVARGCGALGELAFALGVRGWARAGLGLADEGLADVREAAAIADLLGRPEGRCLGLANLSSLLLFTGRLEEAADRARGGLDVACGVGLGGIYGGILAATAAAARSLGGRFDEAREACERALDSVPPGPDAVWIGAVAARLGAAIGDQHLARRGSEVAEGAAAIASDPFHLGWWLVARVEVALADGRPDVAQQLASDALAPGGAVLDTARGTLAALALRVTADRVELARAAGDGGEMASRRALARSLLAGWRRRRKSAGKAVPDPGGLAAIDALCAAEATRAAGASDPAAWDHAARAGAGAGWTPVAAYARYRQGEALLGRRGRRSAPPANARTGAAEALRTASRMARAAGARPLLEAITSLARRARLEGSLETSAAGPALPTDEETAAARARSFAGRWGLTARELEVLTLVCAGWTNGEIADQLFISRKTASVHVSNILGKLGALDRMDAAALAQRAGLVGPRRPGSVLAEDSLSGP